MDTQNDARHRAFTIDKRHHRDGAKTAQELTPNERIDAATSLVIDSGMCDELAFDTCMEEAILTHSCAIEGSELTLAEVSDLVERGHVISGMEEYSTMASDLGRAYAIGWELASTGWPSPTTTMIKALNALVMHGTGVMRNSTNGPYDESRGEYRLIDVTAGAGGHSYLSWEKVPQMMEDTCAWLSSRMRNIGEMSASEVYELSFQVHWLLVTIHPWSDGNGRTSRLVSNIVQAAGGVLPLYVRSDDKAEYLSALAASKETGSPDAFIDHMMAKTAQELELMLAEHERSVNEMPSIP